MTIGDRLGPYLIDRELGSGGMGAVYRAIGPDGVVALKVVHPHLLEGGDTVERFRREVEIGRTIDHPNVVRTWGAGEIDGHHYLVMEYVEGQTLAGLASELGRVPEELCRHIGREMCKGLAAIHAAGVVHRDMKPDNVLVTTAHVVKIMDLGVARSTDDALRLSSTGVFVGSLRYAAPEQFTGGGKNLDGRLDLHALGLVLYELATACNPFEGESVPQTVQKVLHEEPRRLGELNPQATPFFEEVVHCLLAKDREERFPTAEELRAVLEAGEDGSWWRERARALQLATRRPVRRVRIPRETAVYGREKEITRLRALFERAKSGDGQVVLVEGEAGIGKSRLVDELISRLQRDGENLNFLFGGYPPGGVASAAGGFSSAYREHFGEAGSAEFLVQTPLLVPAFDAVLRGEPAPTGTLELTKDSLGTCFVHATRNLAAERTTVVLIDDLHFAPEEARALFTALALAVPGHRVLLVGTARPGVPEDWLANLSRLEHSSRLELARLEPQDLVGLLQDSFKSQALASSLAARIAVKSDGNPFFAFEIVRGLREGQFITRRDDGTWVSTGIIDEIKIPSSVLDLVKARVADLTQDERDLLDVACCWGFEFDPLTVGDVLGLGRIPLLRSLGRIERRHRLVRAAGRRYVFDHHQVQEALYESLSELLREEYHAALAEALESRGECTDVDPETLDGGLCVDLCDHYLRGARGEAALRYLAAAQTHLSKSYVHAQVVGLTERALAMPDLFTGVGRARVLLRLACSCDLLGRRARQEEAVRDAETLAEAAGDVEVQMTAAAALGTVLSRTSRQAQALEAFGRALVLARARGDLKGEARATGNLGAVFSGQGRLAEAQENHERHRALSHEIGYRQGEAIASGNLGNVSWFRGRLVEAREHHEHNLALGREMGDLRVEASAMGNLGNVFMSMGLLAEARDHHERHLALSRDIGDRLGEAVGTGNLGAVLSSMGRLVEAQAHHERHHALSREIGFREGEAIATGNLGNVFHAQGRLAAAREHFERQVALSREIGDRVGEVAAQHNLGTVLRDEREREASEEHLLTCLSACEDLGHRHLVAATHLVLGSIRAAESHAESGDSAGGDRGRAALESAQGTASEIGVPGIETLARCELALLPGGDPGDALAAFKEHADRLGADERREALWLLFRSTGDRAHLDEAKRLLDESSAHADEEMRLSMLTNLRVPREIMAAWRVQTGGADKGSHASEAVTRAG